MRDARYITIKELADMLGVTRIAVYKRVKKGTIKAVRIGRNYAIPQKCVSNILGKTLGTSERHFIDRAVKKTVKEYGEVLKLLGKE